mmetsp:Transcript_29544/g.63329  ORF Transcript_29544/g.63329 Transcript_29544/m.63329 type:complete len:367 (+) Transcript_29544:254-1354(+)
MPPAANGAVRRRGFGGSNFATLQQQPPAHQPKPWFLGAPVTKVICILWGVGSLWVINGNGKTQNSYGDHAANSLLWEALWSGPTSWVFQSTTEMLVGLSFLAHFLRRAEQELSSRRLVAWLILLEVVYVFVRLMAVATLDDDAAGTFVASASVKGPYLVAGGVLHWYKTCVPRLHPRFLSSATLGVSFSEKTLPYLWAFYVLLMNGAASLSVGAIGVAASALYFFLLSESTKNNNNNNTRIPFVDVPDVLVNVLPWEALGGFFMTDQSPKIYAPFLPRAAMNNPLRGGDVRQRRQRGAGRQPPVAQRVRPVVPEAHAPVAVAVLEPPVEAIAQLTSMGFEEDSVKEALRVSDNNVEQAANVLLMGS